MSSAHKPPATYPTGEQNPRPVTCPAGEQSAPVGGFTLSNRLVLATIETAMRLGIPRASLLELAQFDSTRLENPDGRVSPGEFSRLCELVLDQSGDPALGLREGEAMSGVSFNIVTSLVVHAVTLRQSLETLIQIHRLLHDQRRYELCVSERWATLRCVSLQGVSLRVRRFITEIELTGFSRMIKNFAVDASAASVNFEYAAPDYQEEYTRIFSGTEHFDQPFSGIVFDRDLLDRRSIFKDESLHSALLAQAEQRIARLIRQTSYAEQVSQVISAGSSGRSDATSVARVLGISVRSLRRRLASEGTSFQAVAKRVFVDVAQRHLLVEGRTIQETAHAMGYADSSAFHRAFKRWTGLTPSGFLAQR